MTEPVRLSLRIPGTTPMPKLLHLIQDAEAAGFVPDEIIAQLCDALGLMETPEHCAQRIMEMTAVCLKCAGSPVCCTVYIASRYSDLKL